MTHSIAQILQRVDHILKTGLSVEVAPLAVLDADGTIWAGDLGEEAFRQGFRAGLIDVQVVEGALREWADSWGLHFAGDAASWFSQLAEICREDRILDFAPTLWNEHRARIDLYAMQAWAYAGVRPDEIRAYAAQSFAHKYRRTVFAWWPQLLAELRARDIRVIVVSGTHPDLLVPCLDSLGIPEEDIFGSRPALDESGRYRPSPDCALYGERKAHRVQQVCAQRFSARTPFMAFGDSVENTDRHMLEMASVPVAVYPRGKHLAGAQRRAYWVLHDQPDV